MSAFGREAPFLYLWGDTPILCDAGHAPAGSKLLELDEDRAIGHDDTIWVAARRTKSPDVYHAALCSTSYEGLAKSIAGAGLSDTYYPVQKKVQGWCGRDILFSRFTAGSVQLAGRPLHLEFHNATIVGQVQDLPLGTRVETVVFEFETGTFSYYERGGLLLAREKMALAAA